MATIHRKSRPGTWDILYRKNGSQIHRSLGTKSLRKAQRLKKELELLLEDAGKAELVVSDQPAAPRKGPSVEDFWEAFRPWAEDHRARCTVEEYETWLTQFCEFSGIKHLGDATKESIERFKTELFQSSIARHQNMTGRRPARKRLFPLWSRSTSAAAAFSRWRAQCVNLLVVNFDGRKRSQGSIAIGERI